MPLRAVVHDALHPSAAQALIAWAHRVRAEREQTDRAREVADPADFYAPTSQSFRFDPEARLDPVGRVLGELARPDDTWLDVGAGGGRYALPIARRTRGVIAVDPSPSMLDILREGMAALGIDTVLPVALRWPPAGWDGGGEALAPFRADVALMAHVGYDIEHMGPFLGRSSSAP